MQPCTSPFQLSSSLIHNAFVDTQKAPLEERLGTIQEFIEGELFAYSKRLQQKLCFCSPQLQKKKSITFFFRGGSPEERMRFLTSVFKIADHRAFPLSKIRKILAEAFPSEQREVVFSCSKKIFTSSEAPYKVDDVPEDLPLLPTGRDYVVYEITTPPSLSSKERCSLIEQALLKGAHVHWVLSQGNSRQVSTPVHIAQVIGGMLDVDPTRELFKVFLAENLPLLRLMNRKFPYFPVFPSLGGVFALLLLNNRSLEFSREDLSSLLTEHLGWEKEFEEERTLTQSLERLVANVTNFIKKDISKKNDRHSTRFAFATTETEQGEAIKEKLNLSALEDRILRIDKRRFLELVKELFLERAEEESERQAIQAYISKELGKVNQMVSRVDQSLQKGIVEAQNSKESSPIEFHIFFCPKHNWMATLCDYKEKIIFPPSNHEQDPFLVMSFFQGKQHQAIKDWRQWISCGPSLFAHLLTPLSPSSSENKAHSI